MDAFAASLRRAIAVGSMLLAGCAAGRSSLAPRSSAEPHPTELDSALAEGSDGPLVIVFDPAQARLSDIWRSYVGLDDEIRSLSRGGGILAPAPRPVPLWLRILPDPGRRQAGECFLGVTSELFEEVSEVSDVSAYEPEESTALLAFEVPMARVGELDATVLDRAGQPHRHASVRVEPLAFDLDALELRPSDDPDASRRTADDETDGDGRLRMFLDEGWYRVRVQEDSRTVAVRNVFVPADETRKLLIRQP